MSTPYTHPSMPFTRYIGDAVPAHVTDSPARPKPWEAVDDDATENTK